MSLVLSSWRPAQCQLAWSTEKGDICKTVVSINSVCKNMMPRLAAILFHVAPSAATKCDVILRFATIQCNYYTSFSINTCRKAFQMVLMLTFKLREHSPWQQTHRMKTRHFAVHSPFLYVSIPVDQLQLFPNECSCICCNQLTRTK